jgi:cell division inhibitor SepF
MSGGIWHRTLVYLGLKEEPEEGYDELPERFEPIDDPHAEHAPVRRANANPQHPTPLPEEPAPGNVRAIHGDVAMRPVGGTPPARAAVVEIRAFADVEEIGSRYRTGQPVLFDLSGAPSDVARRVVDFVSGLTYASHGHLSKVGRRAFLLIPDGVDLSMEERRRLGDLGYQLATGSDA